MVLGQLLLRCLNSGIPAVVGMKAHIGVDVESGLVHTVTTTLANLGDVTEVGKLLHGKEKSVYADAGYQGLRNGPPSAAAGGVSPPSVAASRRCPRVN